MEPLRPSLEVVKELRRVREARLRYDTGYVSCKRSKAISDCSLSNNA